MSAPTEQVQIGHATYRRDEIPAEIRRYERLLARAERDAQRAAAARYALAPGSSRARVTTANARWASAAEHRDRLRAHLEALREVGG